MSNETCSAGHVRCPDMESTVMNTSGFYCFIHAMLPWHCILGQECEHNTYIDEDIPTTTIGEECKEASQPFNFKGAGWEGMAEDEAPQPEDAAIGETISESPLGKMLAQPEKAKRFTSEELIRLFTWDIDGYQWFQSGPEGEKTQPYMDLEIAERIKITIRAKDERHFKYLNSIGDVLRLVRDKRDTGEPSKSDVNEIRDLITRAESAEAKVTELEAENERLREALTLIKYGAGKHHHSWVMTKCQEALTSKEAPPKWPGDSSKPPPEGS